MSQTGGELFIHLWFISDFVWHSCSMSCEDGNTVAILGSNGKMVEWNGDDYVEQGSCSSKSDI